ncbi:MAG: PHP domain-containing protein [Phycisphaerae bacterium]|nr:PHP domain-containing protein [Phycisphaerae bacterium]
MNCYFADLHIHTALSPCASPEMTPPAIVRAAIEQGLNVIAICDHNSAGNVRATQQAAGDRLAVLAGMEIETAEEAHVLALFPDLASAESADAKVRAPLPNRPATADAFGRQSLLNADGDVVGEEGKMLESATAFSLEQTVALVHEFGGLAIASHVDRPSFSVMSQLGFFPEQAGLDAIEISPIHNRDEVGRSFDRFGLTAITSSDAHFLSDVGFARTEFRMQAPTFAELRLALAGCDGRRCCRA